MSKENLDLLIIEKGNTVDFKKDSNYTFEGIFTEFGVRNKNRRIYEKDQFLPHLESLQSTISENKLLGELDHPKDFEIMLSRASHVIENLKLDESGTKILGRIKLMDTAKGRDAKAIADAGVPLHISSRAAGSVNKDGVVEVKKLFTYDLVADPGFANAELAEVAESLNVSEQKASEILNLITESSNFKSDELILINESLGINESDGIEVYQIVKKTEETLKENKSTLPENSAEKVTVEQLTKWSNVFIKEMEEFVNLKIKNKITESSKNDDIEKVKEYLNIFSNQVNEKFSQFHQFTDYLSEGMNKLVEYNTYLSEGMNNLKNHNNYIVESLELVKGYSERAHSEVFDLKNHNDHIVESSNNLVKFIEHVAEKANQGINYTESIAENAQLLSEYTETIASEVVKISESNSHIMEMSSSEKELISSLGFNEMYEVYEYVLQSYINGQKKQAKELIQQIKNLGLENKMLNYLKDISTKQEYSKIKELCESSIKEISLNAVSENNSSYINDLKNKISNVLENAKKDEETVINTNNKGDKKTFFELLPENYQKQLEALPEDKRQKLKEVNKNVLTVNEATEIFETFISEHKSLNWLDNMPEKFSDIWSKLTESSKSKITLQAKGYELDTQPRINWFWETRDLNQYQKPMLNKVISKTVTESQNQNNLGYQINIDAIVNAVKGIHN